MTSNTDRSWRTGLVAGQQPHPFSAEDFTGLAELQSGFAADQQAWEDLLAGLAPDEFESPISLVSRGGREVSVPRWLVMQHVLLHGMQHAAYKVPGKGILFYTCWKDYALGQYGRPPAQPDAQPGGTETSPAPGSGPSKPDPLDDQSEE